MYCILFIERSAFYLFYFFFFQAEDGIRDYKVTGVQTCALPISRSGEQRSTRRAQTFGQRELIVRANRYRRMFGGAMRQVGIFAAAGLYALEHKIGRASCRERV